MCVKGHGGLYRHDAASTFTRSYAAPPMDSGALLEVAIGKEPLADRLLRPLAHLGSGLRILQQPDHGISHRGEIMKRRARTAHGGAAIQVDQRDGTPADSLATR